MTCIGFNFYDNKTCAAMHQGGDTFLAFLGGCCCLLHWRYQWFNCPGSIFVLLAGISQFLRKVGYIFLCQTIYPLPLTCTHTIIICKFVSNSLMIQNYLQQAFAATAEENNRPGSGCGRPRLNSFSCLKGVQLCLHLLGKCFNCWS